MIGRYIVTCGSRGKWEGQHDAKCIRDQPPTLECPPAQSFTADQESHTALVQFRSPKTNINWKYVKAYPSWGKDLTGILKKGQYDIGFTVKDPETKLTSSCSFRITVD
ncbi:hypothetical protein NQ317_014924 [Molorchus minor]|uniref:HYR domain-containing protein n=1 Tax=Molorchus minor TaxID=1323400 RepID=A0ABQ9JYQ1_9CUCU|nr:hypothetical protein NQ317_014924 [Molorchus minor]